MCVEAVYIYTTYRHVSLWEFTQLETIKNIRKLDTKKVILRRSGKDKLYSNKQVLEGLIHEVTATLGKPEACQFYWSGPTKSNAVLLVSNSYWENPIWSPKSINKRLICEN